MNHAFLIIAHSNPIFLKKIIEQLWSMNHFFFIHIDKKQPLDNFKMIKEIHNGKNIFFLTGKNRISISWGGFSLILCELNLLNEALKAKPVIDYFHLISGADYPCKSNKEFDAFFEQNKGRSFMHFDSEIEIGMWNKTKYLNRVKNWNFNDIQWLGKTQRRLLSAFFNLLIKRKQIPGLVAGWQWFSWHRSLTEWVLSNIDKHRQLLYRFKYTSCSDEMFFHTLLYPHIHELNIEPYNSLRFIEWHPKRQYTTLPLILDETEYNDIIKSGAIFCRKVDPIQSQKLIKKLDKYIQ